MLESFVGPFLQIFGGRTNLALKSNKVSIQNNKLFVAIIWEIFSLHSWCYAIVKNKPG